MPPIAALLLLAGFVPDGGDAFAAAAPLATAALGGLAVGIERQWSGHARQHFAGVRTFTLLGGFAGLAGWLWARGAELPAGVLLAAAAGLILIAYVAASRREVEGTSEVAALVVLAAGFLSGTGALALASGVIAVTLLMLVEKTRLHAWVRALNDEELRAGARFAVMAVVILPLLPEGPYGPLGGVRPRLLWMLVLLFSGLSFAGYIARRLVGPRRGTVMAGLLGGLVSSTQVTLAHARASHDQPSLGLPLASGVLAASTVLFVRTTLAAAILAPALARALLPSVVLPAVVGLIATALSLRPAAARPTATPPANPLQLRGALQMALLFQVVLMLVGVARDAFGATGLLVSGALLGLTDVDAVTVSMAQMLAGGTDVAAAATALAVAILSNTALKLGLAVVVGRGRFRLVTAVGLAAMGAAIVVSLLLRRSFGV
jgi:uncharacterized membrane protein (DUF4010 family)